MQEKLTITDSKRVGKQNTLPTKNAVNDLWYCALAHTACEMVEFLDCEMPDFMPPCCLVLI